MQYFDNCSASAVYEPESVFLFLSAAVSCICDRSSPLAAFRGSDIQLLFTFRTVLLLESIYICVSAWIHL